MAEETWAEYRKRIESHPIRRAAKWVWNYGTPTPGGELDRANLLRSSYRFKSDPVTPIAALAPPAPDGSTTGGGLTETPALSYLSPTSELTHPRVGRTMELVPGRDDVGGRAVMLDGILSPDAANLSMPAGSGPGGGGGGGAAAWRGLGAGGRFATPASLPAGGPMTRAMPLTYLSPEASQARVTGRANAIAAVNQDARQSAMQTPAGRTGLLQNQFDAADSLSPANRAAVQSGAAAGIQRERALQADQGRQDTVNAIGAAPGRPINGWTTPPEQREQIRAMGGTLSYLSPPAASTAMSQEDAVARLRATDPAQPMTTTEYRASPQYQTDLARARANPNDTPLSYLAPGATEADRATVDRVAGQYTGEMVDGRYVMGNALKRTQGEWRGGKWVPYADSVTPESYAQRTSNQATAGVGPQGVADRARQAANEGLTVPQLGGRERADRQARDTAAAQQRQVEDQRGHEETLARIKASGGSDLLKQRVWGAVQLSDQSQKRMDGLSREVAALNATVNDRYGEYGMAVTAGDKASDAQKAYRKRIDDELAAKRSHLQREQERYQSLSGQAKVALDSLFGDSGDASRGGRVTQTASNAAGVMIYLVDGQWVDEQGNPVR